MRTGIAFAALLAGTLVLSVVIYWAERAAVPIVAADDSPKRVEPKKDMPPKKAAPKKPPVEDKLAPEPAAADEIATALRGEPIFKFAIRTVAFHPNGKLLAVGDGGGVISVFDVATKGLLKQWKAHETWTFDLAFSKDGSHLASAGGDSLGKIWNTADWSLARELKGHDDDLHGIKFLPDGKRLITVSDDQRVLAWNEKPGAPTEVGSHEAQATSVAVAPDGSWAATGGRDETVRVWDLANNKLVKTLTGHKEDVIDVAVSRDGTLLASSSYDKTVKVWSTDDWSLKETIEGYGDWVFAATFSHDGRFLLTASGDHHVRMFSTDDYHMVSDIHLPADVADIDITANNVVGVGLTDGQCGLLQIEEGRLSSELVPLSRPQKAPEKKDAASAEEYLDLHVLLTSSQPEQDWSTRVAKLSEQGDGFTLHLIEQMDLTNRKAPQRELLTRIKEKLELRYPAGKPRVAQDEITTLLVRAATADLRCHPLEGVMTRWATDEVRKLVDETPEARKQLLAWRTESAPSGDAFDASVRNRMSLYIDAILEGRKTEAATR